MSGYLGTLVHANMPEPSYSSLAVHGAMLNAVKRVWRGSGSGIAYIMKPVKNCTSKRLWNIRLLPGHENITVEIKVSTRDITCWSSREDSPLSRSWKFFVIFLKTSQFSDVDITDSAVGRGINMSKTVSYDVGWTRYLLHVHCELQFVSQVVLLNRGTFFTEPGWMQMISENIAVLYFKDVTKMADSSKDCKGSQWYTGHCDCLGVSFWEKNDSGSQINSLTICWSTVVSDIADALQNNMRGMLRSGCLNSVALEKWSLQALKVTSSSGVQITYLCPLSKDRALWRGVWYSAAGEKLDESSFAEPLHGPGEFGTCVMCSILFFKKYDNLWM